MREAARQRVALLPDFQERKREEKEARQQAKAKGPRTRVKVM